MHKENVGQDAYSKCKTVCTGTFEIPKEAKSSDLNLRLSFLLLSRESSPENNRLINKTSLYCIVSKYRREKEGSVTNGKKLVNGNYL